MSAAFGKEISDCRQTSESLKESRGPVLMVPSSKKSRALA